MSSSAGGSSNTQMHPPIYPPTSFCDKKDFAKVSERDKLPRCAEGGGRIKMHAVSAVRAERRPAAALAASLQLLTEDLVHLPS